jgi:hypothetical protein
LLCPFHFWEFATTGAVAKVPWLDEPPAHIKAKQWTSREFHGMVSGMLMNSLYLFFFSRVLTNIRIKVLIWFDAENRAPLYEPPVVPDIVSGEMRYSGSWEVDRPIYMVTHTHSVFLF